MGAWPSAGRGPQDQTICPRCPLPRRQEGFGTTADAVRKRLNDLGSRDPTVDPELAKAAQADLKEFRSGLKAWKVRCVGAEGWDGCWGAHGAWCAVPCAA